MVNLNQLKNGFVDFLRKDDSHLKKVEERLSICESCEYIIKATMSCKKCGCFMKVKARLSDSKCPVGKW